MTDVEYPTGATVSSAEIAATVEGQTVARQFLATVARLPDSPALRWRGADGGWQGWTYAELGDRVARATAGLQALGLRPGDRVVLMLRNRPEFHVLDLAVLFCAATPISIYNSSSAEQISYLVGHAGAVIGFVEDEAFLARFESVRDELSSLNALGIVDPPADPDVDLVTYERLLAHDPADLAAAAELGSPDDLATVIYTSGTTGPPKGVMLSNANICWTNECLRLALQLDSYAGKRMVSYLPMAHIAERMNSHYQMVALGYEVVTCPDPGLLATYLHDVRPHVLFGVPRVFEKMHAGVAAALAADPEGAARFAEGVATTAPISVRRAWGTASADDEATWTFLDDLAFRPVRELLGLDQLDAAISGAAPIPAELLTWFNAVGVPLSEIYGMSESCGPITWAAHRIKPGTVGPAVPGCEVALGDDGEVLCRGGNVFLGYLNDPEKTEETLDADGWLHTGDIGVLDDEGYLRIVDRKKELIITAGGKNVSPANLEAALKSIPLIGQAAAIGDQRPFISALLTLDPDVAPVWAAQHGLEETGLGELASHPGVLAEIEAGVELAMASFNGAERVKRFTLLGEEWLPDSALLTPTSKLKRRGIHAHYAAEIEAMYSR